MRRFIRRVEIMWVTIGVLAGSGSVGFAQELEPNNSCFTPQEAGAIAVPSIFNGSIDAADATFGTDVDFYRFSAPPGLALRVGIGFNQIAGLFNEQCLLVAASDSFGERTLDFNVPDSGTFTIAVADRFDGGFSGQGIFNDGFYQLTFAQQPPSIGSISGRLVDAVSGAPLLGSPPQSASVELRRCFSGNCFDFVNSQQTNGQGMFRFELDFSNRRLPAGTYQIFAVAQEFQTVSLQFDVGVDENLDIGDIALIPPPIQFAEIQPCNAILPQGGLCGYSVRIRNNTTARLTGTAFSIVDAGFGTTRFEASTLKAAADVRRARVAIPSLGSRVVTFFFTVPSFVPNGTAICTQLFLGLDPSPLFNTARRGDLFCLAKGDSGFRVMNLAESRLMFERMNTGQPGVAASAAPVAP